MLSDCAYGAYIGVSQKFWVGPNNNDNDNNSCNNKDYSMLGSVLGSSYLWKLPYQGSGRCIEQLTGGCLCECVCVYHHT